MTTTTSSSVTPSTNPHGDSLTARNWPTSTRRPGESIREWIARLDATAWLEPTCDA
jgi:hypothetical protein